MTPTSLADRAAEIAVLSYRATALTRSLATFEFLLTLAEKILAQVAIRCTFCRHSPVSSGFPSPRYKASSADNPSLAVHIIFWLRWRAYGESEFDIRTASL